MMDIRGNEIHLWFVHDVTHDEERLQAYRQLLNDEEAERYRRFMFLRHKRQFLITRALLRAVLSRYLNGIAPQDLEFVRDVHGKPRLANPGASPPIDFNLSHTSGLSVLAVGTGRLVGVDLECLKRQVDILALAERYFSPAETGELKSLEVDQYNERFFDLWTLKEAYIKACGMGLAIPLQDFSFHLGEDEISIFFSPQRDDEPRLWNFWQCRVGDRHRVALAAKNDREEMPGDLRLVCREGVPLGDFSEFAPHILRCGRGSVDTDAANAPR